jgi:2,4-dienoyl-CoA reductase-like NADH-dependent reductase (Old Yellow Enzyme family)
MELSEEAGIYMDTLSRRKFLKTGLAATAAAAVMGSGLAKADNHPLFERTRIKSLELANRAVRSSTWSGVGDEKGFVTDRALEFYGELAKGDIGLILTGYQYVMTNGQGLPYMVGNYDDSQAEGLKKLVDTVHGEGGKIAAQLVHCLAKANPKLFFKEGDELWGASAIPYSAEDKVPREMTREDITRLVEAHAAAASRSRRCGFDGIQLHGAHGMGINQFLSPAWNRRGDMYGGSLQNRYRLVGEILEAIRGGVGKDYPLMFKLSAQDFVGNGLELPESAEIARRLASDGIDVIQVSVTCPTSNADKHCTKNLIVKEKDEAYLADFAEYIKEKVNVPVMIVGGIRSMHVIDGILKEKQADYISMARPFIREPQLVKRWKGGDTAVARCISCNRCFETGMQGLGISCYWERKLKEEHRKT